jgi:hypothetical protein
MTWTVTPIVDDLLLGVLRLLAAKIVAAGRFLSPRSWRLL